MLLASNDNQLINSFKTNTSIFDLIKWHRSWSGGTWNEVPNYHTLIEK
jgi:hypothetical protein